jgi:hypothetical protein
VKALSIKTNSAHAGQAPKEIKLVINQPSIGFEDVEDASVAQSLELTPEQVAKGERVALRFVRFQSVSSLHVRPLSFNQDYIAEQATDLRREQPGRRRRDKDRQHRYLWDTGRVGDLGSVFLPDP